MKVSGKRMRVLLVGGAIEGGLQSAPFELLHVADESAALAALAGGDIDGVLAQLGPPDGHGLELLRRLQGAAPSVPIMALAARAEHARLAEAAMLAGAVDCLVREDLVASPAMGGPIQHVALAFAEMEVPSDAFRPASALRAAAAAADVDVDLSDLSHGQPTRPMPAVAQLASALAHEINNPAAAITANLTVLKEYLAALEDGFACLRAHADAEPDPERRRQADAIFADCDFAFVLEDSQTVAADNLAIMERIRSVVSDLGVFREGSPPQIGLVQINDVVNVACNVANEAVRGTARLVKSFGELPPMPADGEKIGQVVMNLLMNAAAAIPEGDERDHRIEVATRFDGGDIVITVADTGRGIPEAIRPHVFDPFFTTKKDKSKAGMGLPIAAEIVQMHGGDVSLQSEEGKGTTVEVRLPTLDVRTSGRVKRVSGEHRTADPTGRILLCDDDGAILNAYRRMLAPPYQVVIAQGGRAALAKLRKDTRFDAIVCALDLTDLDGAELYSRATDIDAELGDRFVFTVAGAIPPALRGFVDAVPSPVVEKPTDRDLLIGVIEATRDKPSATKRRSEAGPNG
jgi:signal transduction histidine kinase